MQTLGHYSLVNELGQGGMGTVYRALDTRLDRYVALKVLRPDLKVDELSRARLTQEARAASALNHPNIIHIYDVGSEEGVDYIAMECINGRTLDYFMSEGGRTIDEILTFAIQIADALDAAHREGIVHRDLKPGNIMVNERNTIKVLDFGLAKLNEHARPAGVDSSAPTQVIAPMTMAGQTLGTPSYMSPEQAEGRPVDARSDIFSFGILLYQMISSQLPFQGSSTFATLAAVLRDEPKPLSEVAPGVPPQLEDIVLRCLRKDPGRRYRSMDDVKVALEDVKEQRLYAKVSGRIEAFPGPLGSHPSLASGAVNPPAASVARIPALSSGMRGWVIGVLALVAILAAATAWYSLDRKPAKTPEAALTRLTADEGLDTTPAISPDGKLLVYASDRSGEGNLDLWMKQIGSSAQPVRLTKDPADDSTPAFSPDGTKIAFRSERNGGGIYVIPALGVSGDEKLIAPEGRRPHFSPDGTKITYFTVPRAISTGTRQGWGRIFIVDLQGGTPLAVRSDFAAAIDPIYTPDGKHLLFVGSKTVSPDQSSFWWVTPIESGDPVDTGFQASVTGGKIQELLASPIGWHGENQVVYWRSDTKSSDVREVEISPRTWKVQGEPHKLTFGTTRDEFPSISDDGVLVFSSLNSNIDIYSLALNADKGEATGDPRRITKAASYDSVRDISLDGKRLVFLSDRTGHLEVWGHDVETGKEKQLSDSPSEKRQPVITRDGQWVAYAENLKGANPIYVVPFTGGSPKLVCAKCGTQSGWSPDGKQLLITDYSKTPNPVFVLNIDTGQTREVLRHPKYSLFPRSFSPDGKWISFSEDRGVSLLLGIAPFRPDSPAPQSEWIYLTDGKSQDVYPRWSPDGNTIYFNSDRGGRIAIYAQHLDPVTKHPVGGPVSIYAFTNASLRLIESARWISVAQDKIVFSLEERSGSIYMLRP